MKRMASSDSTSGLITVGSCQEKSLGGMNSNNSNSVYNRGYQSMLDGLDEDDGMEESGHVSEKKRRLSVDQVKALEKNFEVENKLEPDRKVKLAQELGLQPRQVAVWFQNRRARWKTKQLERDYGLLKANYDTLKLDFESVKKDNEALLTEVKELKSKLQDQQDDNTGSEETYIKKEIPVCESMMVVSEQSEIPVTNATGNHNHNGLSVSVFREFKDGSSDSDSSAILNEENNTNNGSSPNAAISSSGVLNQRHMTHHMSPASSPLGFNCSSSSSPPPASSSISGFQFSDHSQKVFQNHQFVRMEEHNFFGAEETCNFFSDDQAPTLQWYYSADQWN